MTAMKFRILVVGGLCMLALTGAAQAAPRGRVARRCGDIHAEHAFFRVEVTSGQVGCGVARYVLRRFMGGHGVEHGGPYAYEQWWSLGHWRCGHGAGGGGCRRGAAMILAEWVAWECGHEPAGVTTPCRRPGRGV